MKGIRIDYDRLKGATSRRGIELAKHLGIHQTTFSRKLTGKITLTVEELDRIARCLKTDASRFVEFYDVEEHQVEI